MKTNFLLPAYKSRSLAAACLTCVNLSFEQVPGGLPEQGFFFDPFGYTQWLTVGTGPIRGALTAAGYAWVVSGAQLYRVATNGALTLVGAVAGTGRVQLGYNDTQVVVAHSAGWNVVTVNSLAYAAVVDAPTTAQLTYFASRFFFPNANGTYGWTEVSNGTALDALSFNSAEASPDKTVSVLGDHNELLLFGELSTEWAQSNGDLDTVVTRTATAEYGVLAKYSPAKSDNTVFWVGQNDSGGARVYRAQGYSPAGISDYALEVAFEEYGYTAMSQSWGTCFQYEGHTYYMLTIPGKATWAYDVSSQRWARWGYTNPTTGDLEQMRFNAYFFLNGNHYFGDYETGQIFQISSSVYTHDGNPRYWERTFFVLEGEDDERIKYHKVTLKAEMGVGLDGAPTVGADPKAELSWSDDQGRNFTGFRDMKLGKIGEYKNRAIARRLGMSRRRVFRLSGSDPVRTRLLGVNIQAEPTGQ
jgi:hypothetical protein